MSLVFNDAAGQNNSNLTSPSTSVVGDEWELIFAMGSHYCFVYPRNPKAKRSLQTSLLYYTTTKSGDFAEQGDFAVPGKDSISPSPLGEGWDGGKIHLFEYL